MSIFMDVYFLKMYTSSNNLWTKIFGQYDILSYISVYITCTLLGYCGLTNFINFGQSSELHQNTVLLCSVWDILIFEIPLKFYLCSIKMQASPLLRDKEIYVMLRVVPYDTTKWYTQVENLYVLIILRCTVEVYCSGII